MKNPLQKVLWRFMRMLLFDTYHIEYEARPLNKIKDATEMIEEL